MQTEGFLKPERAALHRINHAGAYSPYVFLRNALPRDESSWRIVSMRPVHLRHPANLKSHPEQYTEDPF